MIKQCCILGILLLTFTINAQDADKKKSIDFTTPADKAPTLKALQKDPNILWIGETMVDYTPDYSSPEASKQLVESMKELGLPTKNIVKILKLQLQDLDAYRGSFHRLNYKMYSNTDAMVCYEDAALTKKYTVEALRNKNHIVDTILTFDPQTFEEIVQVVVSDADPNQIMAFRVKQLIYYDQKAATLKTIPLAIAPMVKTYEGKSKIASLSPAFWFQPLYFDQLPNLNSTEISYAKRTYRTLSDDAIKILKGKLTLGEVLETMVEDLKKNAATKHVGYAYSSDGHVSFSKEEIESMGNSVDTIITFDPVTFDEIIQVVHHSLDAKKMKKVRLLQDWVWNEETKQLGIRFVGFAPIVDRVDDNNNFLNSGPLFYRRPDLDKSAKGK